MDPGHWSDSTRRTVLAGLGAAGVGALSIGTAAGDESSADDGDTGDGSDDASAFGFDFPPPHLTDWSDDVEIGEGTAKTFVSFNTADEPMLLGFQFTEGVLDGLGDEHAHFHVELPAAADETAFEFVGLDWNPEGHPPPDVYTVPHFDLHFYMLPEEEVEAIPAVNFPPGQEDAEPYTEPIPADQFPPNYFREQASIPQMGEHLVNATAPEFSTGEFTNTFVWGHWDGNLHFYEPMLTVEYLEDLEGQETSEIAMPERMPDAGMYPTEYTVRNHDDEEVFSVTLELFEPFEASEGVEG